MIKIKNGLYECPVCGTVKNMSDSIARQRNTCSMECGKILQEAKRVAKIRKKHIDVPEYLLKSHTKLYDVWNSIKQRCRNPKNVQYQKYGAKGIDICDEWYNNYIEFGLWALDNGYKEQSGKLTGSTLVIDRIDPKMGYSPSNCRFITHAENSGRVINGMNKQIHVYRLSDGSYNSSYKSMSDASRALDIRIAHIAETMDNKSSRKQVGGYIFSFEKKDKITPPNGARNTMPIEAFDKDGNSVGIFKKKKDACDKLGIPAPSNISAVLNGKRNHTKGFTFKYTEQGVV